MRNKKKENCIILGGSGFIGSNLTEKLVSECYPVTVIANISLKKAINLKNCINKIKYIKGDINNIELLSKTISENSYVFNLASSSVPSSPTNLILKEIKSQINLIELCSKKKVKKIIFASSGGGVYGNIKKMPISETRHLQPSSPYGIGKTTIEYFLSYICNQNKTPFVIYRISNPYGPKQIPKTGFGLIPTLFTNVLSNESPILFDNGNSIRDFIYIDDLIEAITVSFYKKNKNTIYNIGNGTGTKTIDIWSEIKKITNSQLEPSLVPKRVFDTRRYVLDTKRFRKEFNWKPQIKLSTGLSNTWNWINNNKH